MYYCFGKQTHHRSHGGLVVRYFEIIFSGGCDDSELSICILGEDKPTISEAELFCKDDISLFKCSGVSEVIELSREEAYQSFDMSCESELPIFKQEREGFLWKKIN